MSARRSARRTTADPGAGPPPVAFVDSIEEGRARLLTRPGPGEEIEHFTIPASLLPADAREGTWVELPIRVVPTPPGEDPSKLRQRLGADDDGSDFSL